MNTLRTTLFSLVLTCVSLGAKAQYIQVDDTYTAAQLVSTLLSGDPCSNAANMTVSGDTFSAGQQSFGYFSAGTSSFPFANGIVLATSRATRTEGPNNNLIDEGSNSWGGDTDLEQALGINNTVNATVLEFDFIPYSSHISFDYIFSSEEYHGTATCTYSDGFAFLLKEAGSPGPYQNLALIPNTTTPVLVTSVHPEIPGSGGCPAQNELYFDAFNGTNHPTNFNGQTVPMTAQATVVPGNSYHIKIVIADHENIRYDSAIFLSGGSFQADVDLGPDLLLATDNAVCAGGTFTLTANEPGTNTYKWFRNNVQVPGAFSSVFVGNTPGDYRVEITMGSTSCVITGEVTVEYAPLPTPAPATLVQCDEDDNGNTFFNLERAIDLLTGGDPDLVNVTFYETNGDAQLGVNWITNATNYLSIPKTIYARVVSIYGCVGVTTVTLQISGHSVYNYPLLETCDHDPDPVQDGFYHFTLSDADPQVLDGLPPGLVVEYYETVQDALLHPENVLPNVYYNTVQNDQTIFAKIINGPDCHDIIAVELVVNTLAPPDFEDAHISICAGESVKLDVNDIYESYTWSNGGTTASTTVTEAGIYTITVMENDCTATKTFIVTVPDAPLITNVEIEDMTPGDNTVLIQYTGTGNYEFSLDGVHFQDSPYFSGVAAGEYTVVVRDKFGCGATSKKISVFNFPRFFTPNGDGINDFWTVSSLRTQPNTTVSIFDRYGKLITRFNGDARGWDGKFHSKDLPSSDYWFVITLENGRNVKGHFSLVR